MKRDKEKNKKVYVVVEKPSYENEKANKNILSL